MVSKSCIRLGLSSVLILALVLAINTAAANPIPAPINKGSIVIELESIATGLTAPHLALSANDGTGRLFIVDQPGQIHLFDNGAVNPTPFLDVSARLPSLGFFGTQNASDFDERGLLGLAFHPDFNDASANGYQ